MASIPFAVYNGVLFLWLKNRLHFNDFGRFYYSAQAFLERRDMYASNPATLIAVAPGHVEQLWNMNPPHFELLILPLTKMTPLAAYCAWLCVSAIGCGFSARLILRECNLRPTLSGAGWIALAIIASAPFSAQMVTGQLGWLMVWPLTVGGTQFEKDHGPKPRSSGVRASVLNRSWPSSVRIFY